MAKISKSEVMKEAWRIRRWLLATYAPWQIARGIIDISMKRCMSAAWRNVKELAAKVAVPAPTVEQVKAKKLEIMTIEAKSFRYSIRDELARASSNQIAA